VGAPYFLRGPPRRELGPGAWKWIAMAGISHKLVVIMIGVVCLACLGGCGSARHGAPERVYLDAAGEQNAAMFARGRTGAAGIVVLAESDLSFWTPLLSRWAARGWFGIVVNHKDGPFRRHDVSRWKALCDAAVRQLTGAGADPENLALVGERTLGAFALTMAATLPAVQATVLVSPVSVGTEWAPEQVIRNIRDCPTLVISSENDMVSDTLAGRVKEAAPVFCEWRRYQGSDRGVDLLLSKPVATQELEDWLTSVIESPKPGNGDHTTR